MSKSKPANNKVEFLFAFPVVVPVSYHFGLHAHDHHELVLMQYGRFRSRVFDEEHIAFPGDVLLYKAHIPHEEWAEGGKLVLTWVCAFKYDGLSPDEPVFRWDANSEIQELMGMALT